MYSDKKKHVRGRCYVHAYNSSYFGSGDQRFAVEDQSKQIVRDTSSKPTSPAVTVLVCNPSCTVGHR
jgi:hypothetical protein